MESDNKNMNTINNEILAVIAAAVAAMEEAAGCKLKISSINRIPQTAPAWNLAGRADRMSQKL
jgi:hypothetical protein